MKNKIKAWLESIKGITAIEAISVTIGGASWEGARCHQYGQEKFYLVGLLPKGWKNTPDDKIYITLDGQEYHITAYMQEFDELEEQYLKFHPFGNNWTMSPWEHDDAPQETPCKRQEMTVT